jgi:hypothetical protein
VRLVSYAVRGDPPAIIWWEAGVLAVWFIAMLVTSLFVTSLPLIFGFFFTGLLWLAHALLSMKWVGVVLTNRRLILFRQAAVLQRLRGVPFDFTKPMLEVSPDHMSVQWTRGHPFKSMKGPILTFDNSVDHDPIKLSFGSFNLDDGPTLFYATLPASKSGRVPPASSPDEAN